MVIEKKIGKNWSVRRMNRNREGKRGEEKKRVRCLDVFVTENDVGNQFRSNESSKLVRIKAKFF
jgi:translation elongation factor P/translation initiation factor 5A